MLGRRQVRGRRRTRNGLLRARRRSRARDESGMLRAMRRNRAKITRSEERQRSAASGRVDENGCMIMRCRVRSRVQRAQMSALPQEGSSP